MAELSETFAALECHNLTVRFDGDDRIVTAIENVSLTIAQGSFVSILGPSGCGKSTLLRAIAGLVQPTEGTIKIFGEKPDTARKQRMIGFVFQDSALIPWRNAIDNIALPRELGWIERMSANEPTPTELLELVGLAGWEKAWPRELSGGMRQRVAIARALLDQPKLLLMDEPFGALDEMTRERLNGELRRIWAATGTTVLFVTHSVQEAVYLSEQALVMSAHPGHLLANIAINLPRERDHALRDTSPFTHHTAELRTLLRAATPAS
ncbi:MAG: ABC transporter ATP-binding protein [Beijerinckiaceae bacterium]|nr:ABC transporter ATP-binding protein [Beijerinckiaceae bacterium]